ncbi:MAG: protein kinase [Candidatus Binatia bacterium]
MSMIISRKYEVLGPLGQGGMGVVYKVRHVVLDTVLALKALPGDLTADPEMISRFYREARVMARLRHPNIVRVLDIEHDEEHKFHYFVMEYIQGKTLRAHIQEHGRLPLPEVLTIATQVARALVYSHSHTPPVVHRDIKPANIMIEDGSSRVVVMDFGIAKELGDGEMTKPGVVLGTLKYCPPEQLRNEPLDGSADVYALGMVIYEAYTGGHLFAGVDEAGVIGKVLYESGENEPNFTHPTPPPFAALIKKAITKSRERRYRSMKELLHDIETCFAALNEDGTVPFVVPKTEGLPDQNTLDVLDEQIRKLEAERRQQLVATVRTQTQDARTKALAAGAERLAAVLLQQGEEQETLGHKLVQEGNKEDALDAYRMALDFFTKAHEEAGVAAALQAAEQARQEMQTAKITAERVGAREKARTFYRRALAIQAQADDQWEAQDYQQAGTLYGEAQALFFDAQELASRAVLKAEAEDAREKMIAAREHAVKAEAEKFARAVFLEASEYEQQADTAVQQEEFLRGCESYLQAQSAYERAAREAVLIHQASAAVRPQVTTGAPSVAVEPTGEDALGTPTRAGVASLPSVTDGATARPSVQSESSEHAAEDYWEIGERSEASERRFPPLSTSPRQNRTPLLVAGVLAILAIMGWFGRSLLQQSSTPPPEVAAPPQPPLQSPPQPLPLPALTLAQSKPLEEAVKISAGESVVFAVQAAGAGPFRYQWTLEGNLISQEPQWTYQASKDESGDRAKTVRVQISDQHGQSMEKSWQITVIAANQPPRVIAATPSTATIELTSGEGQPFSLEVEDPEQGKLDYEWTVDGKKTGIQPTFTWKAQGEGKHRVKVIVKDQAGLSVAQEWQVAVAAPRTTPSPPPPPANVAPRITQVLPTDRSVSAREKATIEFSALALDPEGEEVAYSWSVDGKQAAQGNRFAYAADTAGKHRVELEVTDKGGLKDSFHWEVQVDAPPAAPRVAMYTPHKQRMLLYSHLSRFFGVEVETPGMLEPPIQYAWKIDGRPVAGRELLEFKDQSTGVHEIEVRATGPSGASVAHRWVVEVQERPGLDELEFGGPPHLEMFELDNEVSTDKKQIVVKGKLRNVSDREAENVIVWISALNGQQGVVFRRLALPTPQPLAPGQIATFALSFVNRSEISDFRVEIVSK